MKRIRHSGLIFILILFCLSCRKYDDFPFPGKYNVYVAITDGGAVKYAKNDKIFSVTDGSNLAGAQNIFVSGKDVYISGFEVINGIMVAKYWKNGKEVILSNGIHDAVAAGIFVAGNDVYVTGWESNGSVDVAKYWKNGVVKLLTDGTSGTKNVGVGNIFVSGGDVYVAGKEYGYDGTFYSKPMYWKNGKAVILDDGGCHCSLVNFVVVSGNDVYVSGAAPTEYSPQRAVYWKNGKLVIPDNIPGNFGSEANSVFVSGEDVYLAGYQYDYDADGSNVSFTVKTWKNGVGKSLTQRLPEIALGIGLFVFDHDVFVSGTIYKNGLGVAKYWKNGNEITLSDGSKPAWANSIFVAPGF